jgi:Subtilase family
MKRLQQDVSSLHKTKNVERNDCVARDVYIMSALLLLAMPAAAQLALPTPPAVIGQTVDAVAGRAGDAIDASISAAERRLANVRIDRIERLVRDNRGKIERDDVGWPARTGELILVDSDVAGIRVASEAGFALIERERITELEIEIARLAVPSDVSLRTAIRRLRRALPGREITSDQLLFPSGNSSAVGLQASAAASVRSTDTPVGIIDSGVASVVRLAGSRGFAEGAPSGANHGTAVASLLRDAGATRIYAADVYGNDPAGGGTLAVTRAISWLISNRVGIISISLTGNDNALLRRAVEQASARGAIIVAAVGNDGPAAPPAYPASYPQVIAVTAVDGRNRVLIEAGRALHLDYAAPGADMRATASDGRRLEVRGTSYAVPLVSARLAHAIDGGQSRVAALATLDREAMDLGRRGADNRFGRGLLCGTCRATR